MSEELLKVLLLRLRGREFIAGVSAGIQGYLAHKK